MNTLIVPESIANEKETIYTEDDSKSGAGLRQSPGVEIPASGSYVSNIDPLAGTQPRELSRSPAPLFESSSVYDVEDLALLDLEKVPGHLAIIMDGNRRWAKRQGLPAIMGHWKGAETLFRIVRAASELGVKTLTVYSFSTENWRRSKEEVDGLMHLFKVYLEKERQAMIDEGVRLDAIGDLTELPSFVLRELELSKACTAHCNKIDLVLAINYGGRDDIRRAFVAMMGDCEKGKLSKDQVSEKLISQYLDTARWQDPELLIRTSGERRQSNFLLWQLCYSEFYHTDVLWPDFDEHDLLQAVREHQLRQRRLGG